MKAGNASGSPLAFLLLKIIRLIKPGPRVTRPSGSPVSELQTTGGTSSGSPILDPFRKVESGPCGARPSGMEGFLFGGTSSGSPHLFRSVLIRASWNSALRWCAPESPPGFGVRRQSDATTALFPGQFSTYQTNEAFAATAARRFTSRRTPRRDREFPYPAVVRVTLVSQPARGPGTTARQLDLVISSLPW